MGMLFRFYTVMKNKLDDKSDGGKKLVYWTRDHPHRRANGAFLLSAFTGVISLPLL